MKTVLKRILRLSMMVLAVVLLAQLTLLIANIRTRSRAEQLLTSLRKLEVGKSTFDDAKPILVAYKGEKVPPGSDCPLGITYGISISNNTIDGLGTNYPLLLEAGVRPVSAVAVLSFESGRLCEFRYGSSALLPAKRYPFRDSRSMASRLTELSALTTLRAAKGGENYDISSFETILRGVREGGIDFGLRVVMTPDATPSELQHALAFDLSCFTSLRGFQTLCELMPQAVQDAIPKYRARGLPIPEVLRKESEYPACSNVVAANR